MIKNIVIINDFDYIQGGASKVAIETANCLKENNSELNVYFFSASHSSTSPLNSNIINVCTNQGECLKSNNKFLGICNNIYNYGAMRKLEKLLDELGKEDTIVHVHGWTKCLSSSIFHVCFKKKFKIILTMHDYFTACPNGGYFNYKKNCICKYKPLSFKCIYCNCDSRNYFFKLFRVIRQFVQNKIVKLNKKIKNVISISDFSENILKKTLNKNVNIYKVKNPIDLDDNIEEIVYKNNDYYLYVGRISKEKGVDIFCKSVTEAKVKGIVVGDGPELKNLKRDYPNIVFTGWKNSDEVKEYMKKAKALIIPSRWYEGAPLTPLEAMQYGIPVYTSNCNATVDYIKENVNGLIFSDIEDLTEKLKKNYDFNVKLEYENNYYDELISVYKKII